MNKYVEVQPVKYKSHGITVLYYDRVKTRNIFNMGIGSFKNQLNEYPSKGLWSVKSRKGIIYLRFHMAAVTKPLLIIHEDGRFYTARKVWESTDHQLIRHQAGILVELLAKERLMFNLRKRYFSFKKYGKDIGEDIPSENTI